MRGGVASSAGGRPASRPRAASARRSTSARGGCGVRRVRVTVGTKLQGALKPSTGTAAPPWQARQSSLRGHVVAAPRRACATGNPVTPAAGASVASLPSSFHT
jgi:hypothetical protein